MEQTDATKQGKSVTVLPDDEHNRPKSHPASITRAFAPPTLPTDVAHTGPNLALERNLAEPVAI